MSTIKANSKSSARTVLFAYGTLVEPEVMQALLGRVPPSLPARIRDHAAYRMRDGVYPGLVREPGQDTDGLLYVSIKAGEMQLIERFEDEDYERAREPVIDVRGCSRPALFYRIPELRRHLLSEQRWDPAAFRREHLSAYVEMCLSFRTRHHA